MDPVVETAIHAFEQGWSPIPIVKGEKRPAHSDWRNTRYKTKNEIESAFTGRNVGVLLGDDSNGLVDIDLDSPESHMLADGFLPVTRMIHGRDTSPKSHYWYRVEDWPVKVTPFYDPVEKEKMDKGEDYDKAKLVLVEIRGNGGQSLLPPSTHPDGETYSWHGEWHPPAVVPYEEIEKQVRWLAAASLLARYWPGEGKRHAASVALSGGLLNLGDRELSRDAEAFVASVALAAGDEEGFDRQQDVETTRKLVDKGKKVRGWPTLGKIMNKTAVMQAMEWLSPPEEAPEPVFGDGSLTRQTLTDYMTGEMEPHPELVEGLVYASKVTWLQGEPGGGKTIFALWLAVQCANQGYRVMMLDEESGPKMTGERLAALGGDPDTMDELFWYYPFSSINVMDPDHRRNFNEALAEAQPKIILFDSVADILAQAGLRENENDDINSLVKHFVDPLRTQDVACVFIDHMTKAQSDGGWARGAGSKKSKTDAAWTFSATKAFDKTTIGRVSLKRAKDRLGQLPLTHLFQMGGDGEGNIIVKPTQVAKDIVSPSDEHVMRVIEYLKEHAKSEDEALKTTEIADEVTGKTNTIYKALGWIEENLAETPIEMVERGRSKMWFYAGDLEIDWGAVKERD